MTSKLILATLCLTATLAVVSARPRFLMIQLEDVQVRNHPVLIPDRKISRRAAPHDEPDVAANSNRSESEGNEYVDHREKTGGGARPTRDRYTGHPVGGGYGYGR